MCQERRVMFWIRNGQIDPTVGFFIGGFGCEDLGYNGALGYVEAGGGSEVPEMSSAIER